MALRTNLLPIDAQRNIAIRKTVIGWGLAVFAVAAVATLHLSFFVVRLQIARNELDTAQADAAPLQQFIDQNTAALRLRETLSQRLLYLEAALPNDDVLQAIGSAAAAVYESTESETDAWMAASQFANIESLMISIPFDGLVAADPRLEMRAKTNDDAATVRLVENLRRTDRLERVTLKGSGRDADGNGRFVHVTAKPFGTPGLPKP